MQHGYDHKVKNRKEKGEFGGQRTYKEQFEDIKIGKDLMDKWFGNLWFPAFNFPYAPYNPAAIKAVNDCGYKVINSHFNAGLSRRLFYFLGHLFNKGYMFNHHVSWNLENYPGTALFEIDMNASFIAKYFNEECDCEMLSMNELINETMKYTKYNTIGILLHHRYHNSNEKINLVEDFLKWCVSNSNFIFDSIEGIYLKYKKPKFR